MRETSSVHRRSLSLWDGGGFFFPSRSHPSRPSRLSGQVPVFCHTGNIRRNFRRRASFVLCLTGYTNLSFPFFFHSISFQGALAPFARWTRLFKRETRECTSVSFFAKGQFSRKTHGVCALGVVLEYIFLG